MSPPEEYSVEDLEWDVEDGVVFLPKGIYNYDESWQLVHEQFNFEWVIWPCLAIVCMAA